MVLKGMVFQMTANKNGMSAGSAKSSFRQNIARNKLAYLMLLPAIILVLVLCYLPFFGIILAFKDFDIIKGIMDSPWVGFENFKAIFVQEEMILAIWNTLVYGVTILFLGFPFPIILAILFNELKNMRLKKIYQTISYMPYFLSWISIVGLIYTFFSLEGPFNSMMAFIHGADYEAENILFNSKYFLPVIFFSHIWKSMGWSSVIFLAAIAGIDPTLYEAATVDGCGKFQQIIHITLPGIKATAIIVLIMNLGTLFNMNFEQVYALQNVYTQQSTETINTLIYRQGIQNGKYSMATAFGLAQGLVTIVILLTSNFFSKKFFNVGLW